MSQKRRHWKLRAKAIRSVWVVARYLGLADRSLRCRMSTDDALREAMVRSWLAGYRRAQAEAKAAQTRFMASNASFGGASEAEELQRAVFDAQFRRGT